MTTLPSRASGPSLLGALVRVVASPYLLLVYAVVFWAGNALVGRAVALEIPPVSLSFWRWAVGFLVMVPFTGRDIVRVWPVIRRHWRLLLLYVALGVVGCNVLTYTALHDTTVINSALMNSTTPIFVMCLSFVMFREPIRLAQAFGVGVSLLGVVAIVTGGDLGHLAALRINRGDVLMLCSIGLWSTYTILLRWKPDGIPPMTFLTVLMGLGALVLLPFHVAEHVLTGGVAPTAPNVLAILYVAIFPAALALHFWNRAVAHLGATRVSPFVHLMPVFGTLLAVVFLGERFGWHHAIGFAAILTGVYLASARRPATATA